MNKKLSLTSFIFSAFVSLNSAYSCEPTNYFIELDEIGGKLLNRYAPGSESSNMEDTPVRNCKLNDGATQLKTVYGKEKVLLKLKTQKSKILKNTYSTNISCEFLDSGTGLEGNPFKYKKLSFKGTIIAQNTLIHAPGTSCENAEEGFILTLTINKLRDGLFSEMSLSDLLNEEL